MHKDAENQQSQHAKSDQRLRGHEWREHQQSERHVHAGRMPVIDAERRFAEKAAGEPGINEFPGYPGHESKSEPRQDTQR